jgi:hypothetical protein
MFKNVTLVVFCEDFMGWTFFYLFTLNELLGLEVINDFSELILARGKVDAY